MKTKILLLLTFLPILLFAQANQEMKDNVYTKKGSVFHGKIVEYNQGEYVRLLLKSGDTIQLEDANIKKIVQKEVEQYRFKEKGFYYHLTLGLLGGTRSGGYFAMGVSMENNFGIQYNRLLGVGIGIGGDRYFGDRDVAFIPVSLNVRSYLLAQNRTPYLSMNVGYGFAALLDKEKYTKAKGGLMLHPALGIRLGSKQGAFTLDLGVKMQNADLTRNPDEQVNRWWGRPWLRKVEHMRYMRTSLRFGWLF